MPRCKFKGKGKLNAFKKYLFLRGRLILKFKYIACCNYTIDLGLN